MSYNYLHANTPQIVSGINNRTAIRRVAVDSGAFFLGEFVASPNASDALTNGVAPYSAGHRIGYIVTGIFKNGSIAPLFDTRMASERKGTVTEATTIKPVKYTFSATNDTPNGTTAHVELVELTPVFGSDILEVSLFNDAGTATVTRGTTTGSGTVGYCLAIEPDAPYGAKESSASTTKTGLELEVVDLEGKFPSRTDRVFVQIIRSAWAV